LDKIIKSGKKIISISLDINMKESEIAEPLGNLQKNFKKVDIGSYPYFKNKPGTIIVLRSVDQNLIEECKKELELIIKKKGQLLL